eukprot:Protomagalhaensia_sp_Gyna_25__5667@NODE_800_length_2598_cov_30_172724_g630_i0_p1_GENE_NODE_800_length_2598_cov_30_172724_g630_i0NODE_800_length_2598_cov_30_172724_g630_i0_p1_ORF_typecomplete_len791_score102_40zf_CCCH_4/PF18345_1/1_2e03zf_CCCH_4/PF18345_1/0_00045zf_CCCH_4/PF18345_1/8_4e02zfCCCH/PF00642_24/4_7zfCCCH/PF00642_24/0_32zfCCCH/PF00642_24/3e02zfCCCH_3/PF15663_5/1_1e02zfCCCH_3/PF15663_5/8_7Torus/PF16131_5/1_1e03Torus/PF16131_5/1_7Torus/PF16131_5/1_8e04_NODE_800_length_2598_cov_30_172724_g
MPNHSSLTGGGGAGGGGGLSSSHHQSSRSRNRNRHHGNNIESRKSNAASRATFYSSPSLGSEFNLVGSGVTGGGALDGSSGGSPVHAHTTTHSSSMNASGGFFEASFASPGSGSSTGRSSANPRNFPKQSSDYPRNSMAGPWFPPAGIMPELAVPQTGARQHPLARPTHRDRRLHCNRHTSYGTTGTGGKGGSLVPSPPPPSLNVIFSLAGDQLLFSETNMDWTKLNIFRTRLCDRLTQTHTCHMANRCLFSHDVNWPRRTPFLPRATALTLRYIPVWCPRLSWPPLLGLCDSAGKISWTSSDNEWDARSCHQRCTRGDNCPFVHNVEEFLYHPEVYKTRSCCLANDDNFEEISNHCAALCPWYFCPFAHDVYELRDLRASRFAWHPPPQIVDNQYVARTQDFNELELRIIEFVRRASGASIDLYTSPNSPLRQMAKLPPVIRPISGSSLETLIPSNGHRESQFDDLLYTMVTASFLNLLLYPVENFYVPTLLSLQCAVIQAQLELPGALTCAQLMGRYDGSPSATEAAPGGSPRLRADRKPPPALPLAELEPLSFQQRREPASGGRSARNLFNRFNRGGGSGGPGRGFSASTGSIEPPRSPGGSTARRQRGVGGWGSLASNRPSGKSPRDKKVDTPPMTTTSSPSVAAGNAAPESPETTPSSMHPQQPPPPETPLLLMLDDPATADGSGSSAAPTPSTTDVAANDQAGDDAAGLKAILDILKPEELLQMMTLIQQQQQQPGNDNSPRWNEEPPTDAVFAEHFATTPQGTPRFSPQEQASRKNSLTTNNR